MSTQHSNTTEANSNENDGEGSVTSYNPIPADDAKRAALAEEFTDPCSYDAPLTRCMSPGCEATHRLGVVRDPTPGQLFNAVLCPHHAKLAVAVCTADGCTDTGELATVATKESRELLCPEHAREYAGCSK